MKISQKNKERISEQILAYLYSKNPQSIFTSHIANEIIRDEEFVKKLLLNLKKKGFVIEIKQNSKGIFYIRRSRWKLSKNIYNLYNQKVNY